MDINSLSGLAAGGGQSLAVGLPPASTPTPAVGSTQSPTPGNTAVGSAASAQSATPTATQTTPPTAEQLSNAVKNINASLAAAGYSNTVQFAIDASGKEVVVQVVDPNTGKVIRQIPNEQAIEMEISAGPGNVISQIA